MDLEEAKLLAKTDWYALQCFLVRRLNGVPTPKGAYKVDGHHTIIGFGDGRSREGVSEVKSGVFTINQVEAFCNEVRERSKDGVITPGFFIGFKEFITDGMQAKAAAVGKYSSGVEGDERRFDRVQILPIEWFFDSTRKLGGAHVPAHMMSNKKKDRVLERHSEDRKQQSAFNLMMELASEDA